MVNRKLRELEVVETNDIYSTAPKYLQPLILFGLYEKFCILLYFASGLLILK